MFKVSFLLVLAIAFTALYFIRLYPKYADESLLALNMLSLIVGIMFGVITLFLIACYIDGTRVINGALIALYAGIAVYFIGIHCIYRVFYHRRMKQLYGGKRGENI